MDDMDDMTTARGLAIDTTHDAPLTPQERAVAKAGLRRLGAPNQTAVADRLGISLSQLTKVLAGQRPAKRILRRRLVEVIAEAWAPPGAGAGATLLGGGGGTPPAWSAVDAAAPTPTTELAERQGAVLSLLPVYRANEPKPANPPHTAWPPMHLAARLTGGFGVEVTTDTLAGYRAPNGARLQRGDIVWISTLDLEQRWLRAGDGHLVAALVDFPDKPGEPAGRRLVLRVYGGTPAAPRLALQRESEPAPHEAVSQDYTLLGVGIWVTNGYSLNGTHHTEEPRRAASPVR